MHRVQFKIEKQAPVSNGCSENVELFHGIGNKLGFNITGGSDFQMPITIFHVSRDILLFFFPHRQSTSSKMSLGIQMLA